MLAGIYNQVVAVAVSTSIGKTYAVKPQLEAYLEVSDKELAKAKTKLAAVESLKSVPALKNTLDDLAKAAEALLGDVRTDNNLDIIANIIGNHVGDFESIKAFKEQLPNMASIKSMQTFGSKLIDLKHYENLGNLLTSLQTFSQLGKAEQTSLFKALNDQTIIKSIESENTQLDIKTIHLNVKKMAKDLCEELKLTVNEGEALIDLFDKLTQKHLPKLNTLRQSLIAQLPAFLTAENERISKAHPELVVLEHKPLHFLDCLKKRTAQRKAQEKAEKPSGKRKVQATEVKAKRKKPTKK